jgi:glucan phosphoethanolaminetransferase (alkaline phosphatase superfamily)
MPLMVRYCLAAASLVAAALFAVMALEVLSNLFADHQESSDGLYLIYGIPFLLIGAAFLVGAVLLVWPRRKP